MRIFLNAAAALLTGALVLSIASCGINSDPAASTNKTVNPSVSVGLSSEAKKPSDGLSQIAAVNYADHELSEADDLKTLEQKIETKYGVDIVYGGDVRTEFGDESEQPGLFAVIRQFFGGSAIISRFGYLPVIDPRF